jgi:phage terminase Nu1 subunit (DNA packaging protein)
MSGNPKFHCNHRQAAHLLGISEEALRRAVRDRNAPVLESSRPRAGGGFESVYDLKALLAWRLRDLTPSDLNTERARLAREQADRLEWENDERKARLAITTTVAARWQLITAKVRARVLRIPGRLAPRLTNIAEPNVIEQRINAEIHKTLDELAKG